MRGPLAERSEVKTVKRISFVLLAACIFVLAATGLAFANFGPHGGYSQDTDGCAACHRAHTSFSDLGWTDLQGGKRKSALLISNASQMTDFCYACHGNAAPGASTNVQSGVFDSGPTDGIGTIDLADPFAATFYSSNSSYEATLNGGGFDQLGANSAAPVMSAHDMSGSKVTSPTVVWGGTKSGASNESLLGAFRCTSCHDPHGSSNYRLLKDNVNGNKRGGYTDTGTPDPYVISNEEGYPTGGFKKGDAGVTQMAGYKPNYTSPQYAQLAGRAMSSWCAGCHTAYGSQDSTYTYLTGMNVVNGGVTTALGAKGFHRHPVDVSLSVGFKSDANRALVVKTLDDPGLPLEMGATELADGADYQSAKIWDESGNISCLTCHYAHGSAATMDGWAVAQLVGTTTNPVPSRLSTVGVNPSEPASQTNHLGVNPNFSQSLLRYDNRGVCERCHNK
jgi:hypothetical protein